MIKYHVKFSPTRSKFEILNIFTNPAPKYEPKREKNTRIEKGTSRENPAIFAANVFKINVDDFTL